MPPEDSRKHAPATADDNVAFWKACAGQYLETAQKMLVEKDIDVDFAFKAEAFTGTYTPLEIALSQSDDLSILTLLLDAGAHPDRRRDDGTTPLMLAAENGALQKPVMVMKALQKHYKDDPVAFAEALTARNPAGHTAYRIALRECSPITCRNIKDVMVKAVANAKLVRPTFTTEEPHAGLLEDLKKTFTRVTYHEQHALVRQAFVAGLTGEILAIFAARNLTLPLDTLLNDPDCCGSNLRLVAEHGQLPLLFAPEHWVGRVGEMRRCWNAVPEEYKEQIEPETLAGNIREAMRLSLRDVQKRPPRGGRA